MKFRPAALRQLEAPEKLDEVVRLATAPAWLMAGALAVIVAAAATWAGVGTVATTVGAAGVLTRSDGVSTLDASTSGQVTRLWGAPDALVRSGAPLYSVTGADGQARTIDAPWNAYVASLAIAPGQLVEPGMAVADLERVSGASDPLEAAVFVPTAAAPAIAAGTGVTLTSAAASSAVFGTLHGTVVSVGRSPETTQSLQAFLGQDTRPTAYLSGGSVIRVVIRLATVPGAPGTLAWSKVDPGFTLNQESKVQASFTVAREHPLQWLLGR